MASTSYKVHPPAYYKALFHAARYPSSSVLGLLLGTPREGEVDIEDVVPLVHHWTSLGVAIEAGLGLADAYAQARNLKLVGVYTANSRLDEKGLSRTVIQALEAVQRAESTPGIALLIDPERLSKAEPIFLPYTLAASEHRTWIPHPNAFSPGSSPAVASTSSAPGPPSTPTFMLTNTELPRSALAAVKAGRHKAIGDFDDHLEDIGVDFLENREVLIGLVNKKV